MASLHAGNNFLKISCGQNVTVIDLSDVETFHVLPLPSITDLGSGNAQGKKPSEQKRNGVSDTNGKDSAKPSGTEPQPNCVLAADVSNDGQFAAVCDDRKYLHVFRRCIEHNADKGQVQWRLASSRCVSRRCTVVKFTQDVQSILVADKSGDVFTFHLHFSSSSSSSSSISLSPSSPSSASSAPSSHPSHTNPDKEDSSLEETNSVGGKELLGTGDRNSGAEDQKDVSGGHKEAEGEGKLVLGHLSMLLDMILIDGDRFVVTSDRDEKIRVSCLPDAYNIHAYCLGHTSFVISLAADDTRRILLSGSGDSTLGLWTYDGDLLEQRHYLDDFPALLPQPGQDTLEPGKVDVDGEETTPAAGLKENQSSVLHTSYCSHCSLLFVALYKCPHILIYRLTPSTSGAPPYSLLPATLLSGGQSAGCVVSLSVHQCVLWVVREVAWPQLGLEAFRVGVEDGNVVTMPITPDGDSHVSKLLCTMTKREEILRVPPTWQDPIPSLWKSQIDGYIQEYMERKRQRLEGGGGSREHPPPSHHKHPDGKKRLKQ